MEKIFNLKNYKIASLVFAFLFLFGGVFKINDITKLSIEPYEHPYILSIIIGGVFLIISLILYFEIGIDLFSLNKIKISKNKDGSLCTKIGKTKLIIHFDKLQEIQKDEDSVVILPANEYFDDECISDRKSALGAYVDKFFRNKLVEFQSAVRSKLALPNRYEVTLRKKQKDKPEQKSYGIGSSVFLDKALNTSERILLVSVTEQREGMGLYSNIGFIFKAVNEIHREIADNRINNIYIPLLGSGHGGLNKRIALLILITAFSEILSKDHCDKLDTLNIVIYKDDNRQDISNKVVKKIISVGVGLAISKEGNEAVKEK